ncbi:hypothetical protein BX667DRAFT_506973 [Coemansia mojavensis]|nr:hypothetical protein BX667DRAFT_506973 [Coemansia mojavensis]
MRHTPYERLPPPFAASRAPLSPRPSRSPSSSMAYTVYRPSSPIHPAHSRMYNLDPAHQSQMLPQAYSNYPVQPDQAMLTSQFTAALPQTSRNLTSGSPACSRDSNSPVRRQELEEKRRKSHSTMERKRREKTNDIIKELKLLVPGLREQKNLQKLDVLQGTLDFVKEVLGSSDSSLKKDEQPDGTRKSSIAASAGNSCNRQHRRSALTKSIDSAISTCQDEQAADTGAVANILTPASNGQNESSPSLLPTCDSAVPAEEPSSPSKSSIGFITV